MNCHLCANYSHCSPSFKIGINKAAMSTIEVLLRLGCTMVGWMVIYAYCIWTATLRVVACTANGDEMWRLLLGFAPLAIGFAFTLSAVAKLPEVHKLIRMLALPLVVIIPLALWPIWTTLEIATLQGLPICKESPAGAWQAWWAPIQLFTMLIVANFVFRAWNVKYL